MPTTDTHRLIKAHAGAAWHFMLMLLGGSAGAVYDGKFYLVCNDPTLKEAMRVYDFGKQQWAMLDLPVMPPAFDKVLLDVYQDQLIQFGGDVCPCCHCLCQFLAC